MKLGQRLSEEQREQMRMLALEGRNALQISKEVDTSPGTVREYMRKWGIDYRGDKIKGSFTPKLLAEWDRLHERYGKKDE